MKRMSSLSTSVEIRLVFLYCLNKRDDDYKKASEIRQEEDTID
jgi:hypothetical protein